MDDTENIDRTDLNTLQGAKINVSVQNDDKTPKEGEDGNSEDDNSEDLYKRANIAFGVNTPGNTTQMSDDEQNREHTASTDIYREPGAMTPTSRNTRQHCDV